MDGNNVGPTIAPTPETLDTSDIVVESPVEPAAKPAKKPGKGKLILVIILLLIVAGGSSYGGFYFGKKSCNCKCTTNCDSNKDDQKTDDKKDDDKKTDDKKDTKVEAGTDKNTSGKTVKDTKTKKVTLGSQEYELKIEVLASNDDTKMSYQNVYLNGYKFISDQVIYKTMVYDESYYTDAAIEREINTEFDNVKVLKDTESDDEYLVFSDQRNAYGEQDGLYVLKADGTLLKKISIDLGLAGISIETDVEDEAFEKIEATQYYTPDKKYRLGSNGMYSLKSNAIYYISSYTCLSLRESLDMSVEVSKMVVTNGKLKVTDYKAYTSDEEYNVSGAGAVICGSDTVKHQIN